MTDQSEQYRRALLLRLKREDAEDTKAMAQSKGAHAERMAKRVSQIERAKAPLPEPEICPICWFERGERSSLSPVGSPNANDIFRCVRCGHEETISP